MRLLDHYLKAVRTYLPKDAPHDDILLELREHLQTLLEERQAAIGRSLTEREQEEVLAAHGSPIDIANRYGAGGRGLAFGRQLISPETFPLSRSTPDTARPYHADIQALAVRSHASAFGNSRALRTAHL